MPVQERTKRLKQLSQILESHSQESDTEPLDECAAALIQRDLMQSKDSETRLLVACCLADIIRVYAPDAPYNDDQLKKVFSLFIEQLRGLSNTESRSFERVFSLLERLSVVKAFILLIDVDEDALPGLFEMFLSTIDPEHSDSVTTHMLEIMVSVVEESEDISNEMLETLLKYLTDQYKRANPHGYRLAQGVISRCTGVLKEALAAFLVSAIDSKPSSSDIKAKYHELIFELHKIDSTLLTDVVPGLEPELCSENDTLRTLAVQLLARLFAANGSPLANSNGKLFTRFLGRFNDKLADIRSVMVDFSQLFLIHHASLSEPVLRLVKDKLSDPAESVRKGAVQTLCSATLRCPNFLSDETYKILAERIRDKKDIVRRAAIDGLATTFGLALGRQSKSSGAPSSSTATVSADALRSLAWIPSGLFNCYRTKVECPMIHLSFDELVLGKERSVADRALLLTEIINETGITAAAEPDSSLLSSHTVSSSAAAGSASSARLGFEAMLDQKRNFQIDFTTLLELKSPATASSFLAPDEDDDFEQQAVRLTKSLAAKIGADPELLVKLVEIRDQRALRALRTICLPETRYESLRKAQTALLNSSQIDNRVLRPLAKAVSAFGSMSLLNADSVGPLLELAGGRQEQQKRLPPRERAKLADGALYLLEQLSAMFPGALEQSETFVALTEQLDADESGRDESGRGVSRAATLRSERLLLIIANAAEHLPDDYDATHLRQLQRLLLFNVIKGRTERQVQFASRALVKLQTSNRELVVRNTLFKLTSEIQTRQGAPLQLAFVAGAELATHALPVFHKEGQALVHAALDLLRLDESAAVKSASSAPESAKSKKQKSVLQTEREQCVVAACHLLTAFVKQDQVERAERRAADASTSAAASSTVTFNGNEADMDDAEKGHCEISNEEVKRIMRALLTVASAVSSDQVSAFAELLPAFRHSAALCLVRLATFKACEHLISASAFYELVYALTDEDAMADKQRLERTILLLSQLSRATHPVLPLRYIALLSFIASASASSGCSVSDRNLQNKAKTAVVGALFIRTSMLARRKNVAISAEAKSTVLPEYVLPVLIHLLAHHRSLAEDQAPQFDETQRHLVFFLDVLLRFTSNVSFVMQILSAVTRTEDRFVLKRLVSSSRTTELAELAQVWVKEHAKKWTQSSESDELFLPRQFYASNSSISKMKKKATLLDAGEDQVMEGEASSPSTAKGNRRRQRKVMTQVQAEDEEEDSAYSASASSPKRANRRSRRTASAAAKKEFV